MVRAELPSDHVVCQHEPMSSYAEEVAARMDEVFEAHPNLTITEATILGLSVGWEM